MLALIRNSAWWGVGLFLALLGGHLDLPYLTPFRDWAVGFVGLAAGLGALWLFRHRPVRKALLLLWLVAATLPLTHLWQTARDKTAALSETPESQTLAAHFIVGFTDFSEVERLVQAGAIGGLFVTSRNIRIDGVEGVKTGLATLQAIRKQRGEPPLLIATDQEGGTVSRLTPPVAQQPPLSLIAARPAARQAEEARAYGEAQGRQLAAFGVTVNFAPVIDLRPASAPHILDVHTRIAARAISEAPDTVVRIAEGYADGLRRTGVWPTFKHFPGLGGVAIDTHHLPARIDRSVTDLEATDWRPFRQLLSRTDGLLMVGHVTVSAVDAATPASLSAPVISGLLRRDWNFDGVIVTDDLTMGPIYWRGLCPSVVDALTAGADLLLIAYDTQAAYPALRCAKDAVRSGLIDRNILEASRRRIAKLTASISSRP